MSHDDDDKGPLDPDASPSDSAGKELEQAEAEVRHALEALEALQPEPSSTPSPSESGPVPRSLPPNPEVARWLAHGPSRPSFFPDESPEQSRAFVDELLPSLQSPPQRPKNLAQDSGLYATAGMRTSEDGGDQEISTVVLLHTHEETDDLPVAPLRVSTRPGLISSLLGHERALADDEGALAALRTLPRRKHRSMPLPLVGRGSEAARARLLWDLAERSSGGSATRLYLAAAELYARSAEPERARQAHAAAHASDPSDAEALRRHLSDCLAQADHARATELLRAQAQLDLVPEERALALCALAEIEQSRNGDLGAAESAARQARRIHPGCLTAGLLLAELCVKSGRQRQAAEALRRSAELWRDPEGRGALLLEAARLLAHCGESAQAQALYARAATAAPGCVGAALGAYRSSRATSDLATAEVSLHNLVQIVGDPRLRQELARHRARVLHELLGQPQLSAAALDDNNTLLGLRAQAQAAEAAGDTARRKRALLGWAQSAGGSERALALFELARLYADGGERAAAEQSLQDAALAGAPSGLLGLARESLARAAGDVAGLASAVDVGDATSELRAAAKLAGDPTQAARELQLLVRATQGREGHVTAQELALDVAAELSDLPYLRSALMRAAASLHARKRLGPWLCWLDLGSGSAELQKERNVVLQQLRQLGGGSPIVLRQLAQASDDPNEVAALWLQEAAISDAEHSAFAATQAGRYLELAGQDPDEAYAEALDAVRGHWPACFALEAAARRQGDLLGLERAHRELAATAAAPIERAARKTRLGLLGAEADPALAAAKLEQALEDRPSDVLLCDLLVRLSADGPRALRAQRLRNAASLARSPAERRAALLRAAAACEDAQLWQQALELYAAVRELAPDDRFAQLCHYHALRPAGRPEQLVAQIEAALGSATTSAARGAQLELLAEVETERGELGRARMALETLLETQPAHLPALRGLQRFAMQDADASRLLAASTVLAQALEDDAGRAAELRLCVRADDQLALGGYEALVLGAERWVHHDLWYALALEDVALRNADRARFYEAARLVSELLSDPMERASYALRAAEAFEAAAPARAAVELSDALSSCPEHPLALEELGRLYRAAGEVAQAAETFERAASIARSPRHAAALLHSAAVIFQDELHQRERAIAVLHKVIDIDVLFGDAFGRLRSLLATKSDTRQLLGLLEQRLAVPADNALRCDLHAQRARLLLELGERAQARQALDAAVAADAQRPELLRQLAELCLADAQYREAADALIQLARITTDTQVLAFAFYELGVVYDEHLPDARRAEIAFTRVVSLAPADLRPVERLIALWRRGAQPERAMRALRHLIAGCQEPPQRIAYVIELAQVLQEQNDLRAAEQVLDEARRDAPASVPVLGALTALYERQGDREARAMHLSRSCHALRTAIEDNPAEVAAWLGLCEFLEARERADAATMTANAARALGHTDATLLARCAALPGLGQAALGDGVQRRIHQRGVLDATRAVVAALQPQLDTLLPSQHAAEPAALDTRSQAVRAAAELFGLRALELRATREPLCIPVADKPPTVLVRADAFEQADDAQRFFMLGRALAIARHGLTSIVRADPERLLLLVHAAKKLVEPSHGVAAVDLEALAQLTAELNTTLPDAAKAQLPPLLLDLFAEGEWNPRRAVSLAQQLGSRAALCVTGNVEAAVDALILLKGRQPSTLSAAERQALARTDPQLRALLSFAVSEAYLEARREIHHSTPPEPG